MTYEKRGGIYHLGADRYRIRRVVDGQAITENVRGTKKEARARWEALGTAAREGKLSTPRRCNSRPLPYRHLAPPRDHSRSGDDPQDIRSAAPGPRRASYR
jgi:hypothetical protein